MTTLADIRREAQALSAILAEAPAYRSGYTHSERRVVELDVGVAERLVAVLRAVDAAIQARRPA